MYIMVHTELFYFIRTGDFQSVPSFLKENLLYTLSILLLAMIIQNAFTIIPLLGLITVNVALFGFFNGFLWSWFTSIIAAIIIFMSVRYCFQDWVLKKINPALVTKVEQAGFMYVIQGRIFPFVPTSLVNIIAGLSSIRFMHFLLGTIIGNFVYFFVLSLIPFGILSVNLNKYVLGGIILLTVLVFYVYKRKKHTLTVINQQKENEAERNF